jgi:hypothetical protein
MGKRVVAFVSRAGVKNDILKIFTHKDKGPGKTGACRQIRA